jgi:hypothetical protein
MFTFWVFVVIICFLFAPIINGINIQSKSDMHNLNIENQDISSLVLYTVDKTGMRECIIDCSNEAKEYLVNKFENLRYNIVNEPFSEKTKSMKSEFAELLVVNDLLPEDMLIEDIVSLLNPSWLEMFEKQNNLRKKQLIFNVMRNFFIRLEKLQKYFIQSETINLIDHTTKFPTDIALEMWCSLTSFGTGMPVPMFIAPRPRFIFLWFGSDISITNVGSILYNTGFIASGSQTGFCLGFLGVGLAFTVLGTTYYGFIGYSAFVHVTAEFIEHYGS